MGPGGFVVCGYVGPGRCVCRWAAARRVACCPDRFPATAWPVLLGRAAVCAGGRRPAREIATREPGGSEWSISKPDQAPPPPTGTAAWPTTIPQHSRPALTPLISVPTPNFACNSPATISNLEFRSLELQRFQTLLKIRPIELHATFA